MTTEDLTMIDREKIIFGCTHAEAGAWFAEETGLPAEIVHTIKYHHSPAIAADFRDAVAITSLAEGLSRRFSPRIEDDGIWLPEHDAILLEYSITSENMMYIGERFFGAKHEIDGFF